MIPPARSVAPRVVARCMRLVVLSAVGLAIAGLASACTSIACSETLKCIDPPGHPAAGNDAALAANNDGGIDASDPFDSPRTDVKTSDAPTPRDARAMDAAAETGRDAGVLDASVDAAGLDATGDSGTDAGAADAPADSGNFTAGLLALYLFDEVSGPTAMDSSGNGHTAMMQGATFAPGLQNNAATLSGTASYVSLPSGIVNGLTSFSIAAWIDLAASPPLWSRIFDFGTGTTVYMFLTPHSQTGTLRFAITTNGNGAEQQLEAPMLAVGTWQHVAVTLTGTTGTLYVDGVAAQQNTAMTLNPTSLGTTTQNWLGRSQFSGNPYLTGQIDNLRIYNRALSASEVQLLYQQRL